MLQVRDALRGEALQSRAAATDKSQLRQHSAYGGELPVPARYFSPVLGCLSAWLSWWRDVLLVQSGAGDGIANVDLMAALQKDAGRYEPAEVISFVQALVTCRERLEANVQARIALDAMIVIAPRAAARAR